MDMYNKGRIVRKRNAKGDKGRLIWSAYAVNILLTTIKCGFAAENECGICLNVCCWIKALF